MILAEFSVKEKVHNRYTKPIRMIISQFIPIIALIGIMVFIFALSASILPPIELLIIVLICSLTLSILLHSWLVKLHTKLQLGFLENMKRKQRKHARHHHT